MNSYKRIARLTGVLYLIIFFANMFAYFFVGSSTIVPGDASATANNIMASESLFRAGIVSYLIVFLSDLGVAVLLYVLLKPVNRTLAQIAMIARLVQTAIHGINLINYVFPLLLLSGADYLTVFEPDQIYALVQLFLSAHSYGVLISEAFFALALFVLGYLVFKSELFSGIFGILLAFAALGYVLDSFGIFLMPNAEELIAQIIVAPAVIGELSFTLWLLIKGVKSQHHDDGIALTTSQVEGIGA